MFCTSFIDFVNDAGLTQFVTPPPEATISSIYCCQMMLIYCLTVGSNLPWVLTVFAQNLVIIIQFTLIYTVELAHPQLITIILFIGIMLMLISLHLTIIYCQLIGSLCWLIAMMLMYIGTTLCAL